MLAVGTVFTRRVFQIYFVKFCPEIGRSFGSGPLAIGLVVFDGPILARLLAGRRAVNGRVVGMRDIARLGAGDAVVAAALVRTGELSFGIFADFVFAVHDPDLLADTVGLNWRTALGRHQQVQLDGRRTETREEAFGLFVLEAVFGGEFVKTIGAATQGAAASFRLVNLRHR